MQDTTTIVGTVRGRHPDGSHHVVRRDGKVFKVHFDGAPPSVGSDVIGNIVVDDNGNARMSMHSTLIDALLSGHSRMVPVSRRVDLTARLLAKLMERSKSAVFKPGAGMAIERMPHSPDPDLKWAMDCFRPEAERLGLALNVIDVKAVAVSPWDMKSLQAFALPADIEGSRRSKDELTRLLRSGFHPACSRVIERFTGSNEISVNFVIPYSPFAGAIGFARDVAKLDIGAFPMCSNLDISETRRISSARQMALALAHNRLSVGRGFQADVETHPRARHLSNCFADAAAALFFLRSGGRPDAIQEYGLLRETSLFFGFSEQMEALRPGVLESATHRAVYGALEWFFENAERAVDMPTSKLVTQAVRIAKDAAFPGIRFAGETQTVTEKEMESAVNAANLVAVDLRTAEVAYLEVLSARYKSDLDALIAEHRGNPVAASRLLSFGALHVPDRMEKIFRDGTEPLADAVRAAAPSHDNVEQVMGTFAKKIKNNVGPMDFDMADEPPIAPAMSL